MAKSLLLVVATAVVATQSIAALPCASPKFPRFNIDPASTSVSGFSAGGFMAAQLGIAYSDLFKTGFGVFAGGPYDCARDQGDFSACMFNATPSITQPLANMCAWSKDGEIDCVCNLRHRQIYLQAGLLDDVIGVSITGLLHEQLLHFVENGENMRYVVSEGFGHTMPTDLDMEGFSLCNESVGPYISDCGFDGAGAVLKWLYGETGLQDRRGVDEELSGEIINVNQEGKFGAPGLARTGYMYVPESCRIGTDPSPTCKLHVVLHGCTMNYEKIGDLFVIGAGYNLWADTNNIIMLYPQTTIDNATYPTWSGDIVNANACFDWIGQYGDSDRKGGLHMQAIVNMVRSLAGLA